MVKINKKKYHLYKTYKKPKIDERKLLNSLFLVAGSGSCCTY